MQGDSSFRTLREAVIALSIVFLASVTARDNKDGLTYRYRVAG